MDIEALQTTLRTFAAERDWQPFHTPKNLSTALIVCVFRAIPDTVPP